MSFGLQVTAVLKLEEKPSKKKTRTFYLHVKWEYHWQEKKGAEERRCKGRADCQKNEWRNRDRRHCRPNLDGFCPCGDCRQHKLSGSDLGLAVTRNSVISHTVALTHTPTNLSHTLFTPHSVLPSSSLQSCNPAEGHKLNPISTWLSGNVSHFLSIIPPQSEREGRGKNERAQ